MISYCKNGRSAQVLTCPLEKFNEIVDSPRVAQTCRLLASVDHDSDDGKVIRDAGELQSGDTIETRLANGTVHSTVK